MDTKDLEAKLKAILDHLRGELVNIRANRPNPQMIENIMVDYAGLMLPIKQIGTINVVPPRELHVTVWDPQALGPASKAIEAARTGLSVAVTGNMIRVSLPMMSDERREEVVKIAKQIVEQSRIAVRGSRDEANKKIDGAEKAKAISEDMKFSLKKKIRETVDRANKEIEVLLAAKIKEIEE